jgi:hypothetical protein
LLHRRGLRRRRGDGLCRSVVLYRAELRRLSRTRATGSGRPRRGVGGVRGAPRCAGARLSS